MSNPPDAAESTQPVRPSVASLHEMMMADFESTLEDGDARLTVMHFRFAGLPVRIRSSDPDLLWLVTGAFRHLAETEDHSLPPVLTIDVWTAGPESDPPATRAHGRESPRYFIFHCPEYDGSLDMQMGHMAIRAYRTSNAFLAHPFRRMLWRWFGAQEIFPLQGALLARGDKAVLLVGERGSGRSSAVLECLDHDWKFLADCQSGLSRSADRFTGYSLFGCIELDAGDARTHRTWMTHARPAREPGPDETLSPAERIGNERTVFNVADTAPERIAGKARLAAIAVLMEDPDRDGPATGRLARRAALAAMTSDARGLDRTTLKSARSDYLKLAEHVPCFAVMRRTRAESIVPLLEDILAEVERGT